MSSLTEHATGAVTRRDGAGLTALVPLLRFVLHVAVFRPLGTRAFAQTAEQRASGKLPPKAHHRRKKLTESLWKLAAYSTLLTIGIRALYGRHWALRTEEWWRGYPNQGLEPQVELYYNAELAFYGASMFMLLVWEERRHDFLVMMTHHLVTIFLIAFSYHVGFMRIGAVVMILHDPSDIFLESAKAAQYLNHNTLATACFVLLLLSWFSLRLVIFPFWLIRSALFEVATVLGAYPPHSFKLVAMLCALVAMHVYWFALIARIAWVKVMTGETRDTREDDD